PPVPHPHLPSFPTRRSSDLLLTPGIILRPGASTANTESPAPNKTSQIPQTSQTYSNGQIVGQALLQATVDVSTLPTVKGIPRSRSEEHTSELQSRSDLVCRL